MRHKFNVGYLLPICLMLLLGLYCSAGHLHLHDYPARDKDSTGKGCAVAHVWLMQIKWVKTEAMSGIWVLDAAVQG